MTLALFRTQDLGFVSMVQIAALAEEGWGKGMVTFIGDAAHAMRPTGQGLNTGLAFSPTNHLLDQMTCVVGTCLP